jgi:hypothetical protein
MDKLREIYDKICNTSNQTWLNKLNLEYALFRVIKQEKFILIRSKGIFNDKSFIEDLQMSYELWIDVLKNQVWEFSFRNGDYWVLIDRLEDWKYCLFLKDVSLKEEFLFLLLLQEIEEIKKTEAQLPNWYIEILWENIHRRSPILVQSEIGSLEKNFIDSFLRIKLGSVENVLFFEPLDLSERVQSSELFGEDPGERFKKKDTIPIMELSLSALVIVEVANLSKKIQKRVGEELKKESSKWKNFFCVFTSNYDVQKMVEFEKFDPLLWEAIKNNRILLPPLRKVPTNFLIEEVKKFIEDLTIKYRKKVILSDASVEKIKNYSWPGNLEELYQTIETAFILSREGVIQESDLLIGLWKDYEKKDLNLRKNIENLEKAYILQAYRLLGGNQVHMANVLGISRGSLQYKLQKYGIKLYDES